MFLNLADQPVLIVGGGAVGLRKAQGVLAAGAQLTVVSLQYGPEWDALGPAVTRIPAAYQRAHMAARRWCLAFTATNVAAVNQAVAHDAAAAGILCCRCDLPDQGDFSGGAIWQQAGLTLAVSTSGASPVLSRRIRDACVDSLDPVFSIWAQLLADWRARVLRDVADARHRRLLLREIAGPEMEQTLRQSGRAGAQELFARWLSEALAAGRAGGPQHGR